MPPKTSNMDEIFTKKLRKRKCTPQVRKCDRKSMKKYDIIFANFCFRIFLMKTTRKTSLNQMVSIQKANLKSLFGIVQRTSRRVVYFI